MGKMTNIRAWIGVTVLALSTLSSACLWDRDTLADQNSRFPGFFEATLGWFDKNPNLYYTMRANRIARAGKSRELTFEEIDDAAVSLDRTGDSDKAITWMGKKKARLDAMGAAAPKDHLYRYHSNLATFQIHKWLAHPNKKNPVLVRDSISNLEKAIEINPDAHFGREAVQLNLTKLILFDLENKPNGQDDKAYKAQVEAITSDLNKQQNGMNLTPEQKQSKALEGITGIIILGYGYSLPDMYTLAKAQLYDNGKMKWVCDIRMKELEVDGVGHVFSRALVQTIPHGGLDALPDDKERINALYIKLRNEADAHNDYRAKFMTTRLKKGLHPDTSKSFWDGYKPLPSIDISIPEPNADPRFKGRG